MSKITRVVLWIWVVTTGILIGGAIYEGIVLLPLWANSPPDSVRAWQLGVPQVRFFGFVTPFYGVCSLALLILSFRMPSGVKKLALAAGASGVVVVIWTFLFFVPILQQTQATGGTGMSSDEIVTLTNRFVSWNYLRYVVIITGWLAGLLAFSRSGSGVSRVD